MSNSVYDRLRADIIAGIFLPEHALVETTLGERYGTSRTPIREALQRLESELLVERSARGMRVRGSTPEEILEIYEVRIELEGLAARIAAHRHTQLDLIRIKSARDAMEAESELQGRAAKNRNFHQAIWAATHNATLVDQLERLNLHLLRYTTSTYAAEGRWGEAVHEHELIVKAIEARNGENAERLAEEHMSRSRDTRLELYARETPY